MVGPLRSPSASSQGPARAAGFPPAPPLRPPAPVGSGSFSAPLPASCSPPSQGRRRRAGCGGEAGCCAKAAAAAAAAAAERRSAPPRPLCATAAPPAAQEQPGSHCLPGGADEPRAGARAPGAGTAGERGGSERAPRTPGTWGPPEALRMLAAEEPGHGALPAHWGVRGRRPPRQGFYFDSQRPIPAPGRW